MITRIRDRSSFDRLRHDGSRIRQASLWCIWCPNSETNGTAVAFAVGRALGNAVTRNRVRRRLKALLFEADRVSPLPHGLMLIGATPKVSELTFDQLSIETQALIAKVRRAADASNE